MIKIGLIGLGSMGGMHAACYEALAGQADFQVTAVADKYPERAAAVAEKFGAAVYASGEQLIAQADVNTVDICLPTYLHTRHALLAMDRDYHVFIEKPVCLNEEEAVQLLAKKRQSSGQVMVGHCIRFWPEYQFLKKLNDEHTYGQLISGVFKRISPRPTRGWNNWFLNGALSGSAGLDLYIHDVDFVRNLLGNPESGYSAASVSEGYADHMFSIYKYGDVVITLEGGWGYPAGTPFEMSYRARFQRASVTYSSIHGLHVHTESGETFTPQLEQGLTSEVSFANITSLNGYYNELLYFLRHLEQGIPISDSTLEDGVDSFRLTMRDIDSACIQVRGVKE